MFDTMICGLECETKEDIMKNKKILLLVAMTAALSFSMTACSFGGGDEEVVVTPTPEPAPEPTEAPEPTPTIAPNIQDTTYKIGRAHV